MNPPKSDEFFHSDSDEDEHDAGDNDDLRPLTRDELKIRTLNKLQKKNNSSGGALVGGKIGAGKK